MWQCSLILLYVCVSVQISQSRCPDELRGGEEGSLGKEDKREKGSSDEDWVKRKKRIREEEKYDMST